VTKANEDFVVLRLPLLRAVVGSLRAYFSGTGVDRSEASRQLGRLSVLLENPRQPPASVLVPHGCVESAPPAGQPFRTYTVPELAATLHVHPRTAQRYLRERRIPAKKVGNNWLVSADAVRNFLSADQDSTGTTDGVPA
jgi:excisionase family DNA binding protein